MNKSLNNSDVDLDINSIFNRHSSPNSPFLAVSPFFSGQYALNRQKSSLHDGSKLFEKLLQVPDIRNNTDIHKSLDQPMIERTNQSLFSNWKGPLLDLKDIDSTVMTDLNSQCLKFIQQPITNRELEYSRVNSAEKGVSTGISTESMVLFNPKARQESNNLNLKERIEDRDEQRYNLTTFYLKKFNMFSKSLTSLSTNDELTIEPSKPSISTKKLNKLIAKPTKANNAQKNNEKRSKKKTTCNCKNSSCIKLYCECFRENGFCGSHCKCKDCKNVDNNKDRNLSLNNTGKKQRKQFAFKLSKEELNGEQRTESISCKCKRSQCQKKYCECFNDGAFCNPGCCCEDCLNMNGN